MQKQTIVAIAVGGCLVGGICLMSGIVGGLFLARGLPRPLASTVAPQPGPVAGVSPAPVEPTTPESDASPVPPAPPTPRPAVVEQGAWETRTDAQGFTVSVPHGWTVESDHATGRARLAGPRGDQILAWPIFVPSRLDDEGAKNLVETLAQKLVTNFKWMIPDCPRPGVARTRGLSGGAGYGLALLTWTNGPEGAAGQLLFALPGIVAFDEAVTARIIGSFRPTGAPSSPGGATAAPALSYVRWKDPNEGSFTVEVPKGWRVEGGLRRLAPTDVRGEIVVTSPDGLVRVSAGDFEIPTFCEPTQMGQQLGFTEGKWYSPSGLQQFMIRRYVSGLDFGRDYVTRKIGLSVAGVQIVKERERRDLVAALDAQTRQLGVPGLSGHSTAGEVALQGQLGGRPCVGSYFVGTQSTTMQSPGIEPITLWSVVVLYGYAAVKEKASTGASALDHLVQTFEYTPEWIGMQQNITMASSKIMHDTNVEISKKISDSYWDRSASETELSRRRSNATLGVEDVDDPTSGRRYKVESGSNYYWLDDRGNIVGTNTPGAPAIEYRELVRQP